MDVTPELIDAWKWELAVQVRKCRQIGTDSAAKKADFLEGFYSALTSLEIAMSGKRSSNPPLLNYDPVAIRQVLTPRPTACV